jgi:hypothetical protein
MPTLWIGCVGWIVLMAGLVALLRAWGRGRCGWEAVLVIVMACVPPVLAPMTEYFHPEDLMAMGLSLGALACARRGSLGWTGVLFGLAVLSQQFAVLLIAPLFVLLPWNQRIRMAWCAIGTASLVVIPLVLVTEGHTAESVILGPGTPSTSGLALLGGLPIQGLSLVVACRGLPIVLSMALAWLAQRRLGSAVLEPVPLVSIIATSLTLRLVFEVNLFGYYFMAVAVSLVLLEILRGRISMYLVGWLILVVLGFDRLPWGFYPLQQTEYVRLWQLVVVPFAGILAIRPLIECVGGIRNARPHLRSSRPHEERSLFGSRPSQRWSAFIGIEESITAGRGAEDKA